MFSGRREAVRAGAGAALGLCTLQAGSVLTFRSEQVSGWLDDPGGRLVWALCLGRNPLFPHHLSAAWPGARCSPGTGFQCLMRSSLN